jgi:tripartite-type tricarboxylate transporter receptor subunit TctC
MPVEPPRSRAVRAIAASTLLVCCLTAEPAAAADFYAGRTIEFLIGGDVGGGYDIYARVVARHLHRFIPGNPTIVPKNQPGAGSGRAASFLYSVAPKDGSVIGAVFPGAIMGPLLDDRAQALYEPTKFQYLGSADNATRVCISHARSKIKRFEDTLTQKTIMGASAAGGSTRDYVNMHRKTTGAMFELVAGYKGTADIFLAMERGEVDGMCGLDWASLKSQRPDWVRDKTVNILAQVNLEPEAELSRLGVPQIWKFIASEDDRKAVALIIGQQVFGRPYLAPPGIAGEPLKILRTAFAATMQDKEFLADAERTRIDVVPSTGEKVQQLVEQLYATPKATVERAKDLIKP